MLRRSASKNAALDDKVPERPVRTRHIRRTLCPKPIQRAGSAGLDENGSRQRRTGNAAELTGKTRVNR